MAITHTHIAIPDEIIESAFWNATHTNDNQYPSITITGATGNTLIVDTNVLVVDATNNRVGIGTAAPGYNLEVYNSAASPAIVLGGYGANGIKEHIQQQTSTGGSLWLGDNLYRNSAGQYTLDYTSNAGNALLLSGGELAYFGQAAGANPQTLSAAKFVIDTTGNVGIGTTGPTDELTIGDYTDTARSIGLQLGENADGEVGFWETGRGYGIRMRYNSVGNLGLEFLYHTGNDLTGVTSMFISRTTGNVGIGTAAPGVSAILELASTTGALLITRMTTAQRNALTAINGMILYNSTDDKFQGYENGAWVNLI